MKEREKERKREIKKALWAHKEIITGATYSGKENSIVVSEMETDERRIDKPL